MSLSSGPVPSASTGPHLGQPGLRRREPPKAIQLLLPVWGTNYIRQFLQVSLPTLLAPGNVPALVEALPCKLVILTSFDGAEMLKVHPGIQYVQSLCEVEFSIIDDLITGDNYSTTVTLAYARAVQAAGAAMLDTCFFFLISDYVIADGSLRNVLGRIMEGYSGVFAGNFQVIEEGAKELFFETFDRVDPAVRLPPRDLIGWAFKYLHPMTIANTVNFPLCHSAHSNRLFWRVDETTMIGRFYLMHMICIRPEVTDFVIGSSCDYSFMPEMCPSNNVHVMTDSDEYLVVEMQSLGHESHFVRLGPPDQETLAESLAEWTTARHRANAHSVVVFHVGNQSPKLAERIAELKSYIDAIETRLPAPQPHRNHPYWIGAIAAHLASTKRTREGNEGALEGVQTEIKGYRALLYRGRDLVFGRHPNVKRLHPRWFDYKTVQDLARRNFADRRRRILIVSGTPEIFRDWFGDIASSVTTVDLGWLSELDEDGYAQLCGAFDGCLLVLQASELDRAKRIIDGICPILSPGSLILVFALNGYGLTLDRKFGDNILQNLDKFFSLSVVLEEILFVRVSWKTLAFFRLLDSAARRTLKNKLYLPVAVLAGGVFFLVKLLDDLFQKPGSSQAHLGATYSSIAMVMRPADTVISGRQRPFEYHVDVTAERFEQGAARLTNIDPGT